MRQSPMEFLLARLGVRFGEAGSMRIALSAADEKYESSCIENLGLADTTFLYRIGLKGPKAGQFLVSLGLPVPQEPNHWEPLDGGGYLMRLGMSEFFLEDAPSGTFVKYISEKLGPDGHAGVYPVRRQDAGMVLCGKMQNELLAQTCNVNFAGMDGSDRIVVMTSMTGVSVVMIQAEVNGEPSWKIWCDGTFGHYLWDTLLEIALETGGGVIGCARLYPELG